MPFSWQQDAELTDIHFVDNEIGWIVGDRGTVLRTIDGGKKWSPVKLHWDPSDRQGPDVNCRLNSVHFATPDHGWIAGGYRIPGSNTSRGVLFATRNGGDSWSRVPSVSVPAIREIQFSGPLNGLAIGDGNSIQPSGIFRTADGGQSWIVGTSGKVHHWRTGSHADGLSVLAGFDGSLFRFSEGQFAKARIRAGAAQVRQIRMIDDQIGFAVADQGLVLETQDGGRSWHPMQPTSGLPGSQMDFETLAIAGQRIWVAGNPGTCIFTRTGAQPTWQKVRTPLRAGIHKLHFVDESTGWAISQCGAIIHTNDSGMTWSIQRRGTRGIALLQISERAEQMTPELFSKYSSDENYISAALLVRSGRGKQRSMPLDQVRQALARVGGSFVNQRYFDTSGRTDAVVADEMQEYLVRQIRALQPRVITVPSGRVANQSLGIRSAILGAVYSAADPQRFAGHGQELGLEPWQVGKVLVIDSGTVAALQISPRHFMTSASALLSDHSAPSRMLLNRTVAQPESVSLTTIYASPFLNAADTSLFGSIESSDGRVPKRQGRQRAGGNMIQLRQLSNKQNTLKRFIKWANSNRSPGAWNTGLSDLTLQLSSAAAGVWLYELAGMCERNGDDDLAAEVHLYMTRELQKHPMAIASFRWLYQYYSSDEYSHVAINKTEQRQIASAIQATVPDGSFVARPVDVNVNGQNTTVWKLDDPRTEDRDVRPVAFTREQKQQRTRIRWQKAQATIQAWLALDPTAVDAGRIQISRNRLNQKLNPSVSYDGTWRQMAQGDDPGLVEFALRELAIHKRSHATGPVLPVPGEVRCHETTGKKPFLDGVLDDSIWLNASKANSRMLLARLMDKLKPEDRDWENGNDEILLATDRQYLYIGIRCDKSPKFSYSQPELPRSRDDSLVDGDRIELILDTDRDSQSQFLFAVDSSGRLFDSLGNNIEWNPNWYVAAKQSADHWVAEIAVPLEELPLNSNYWLMAAGRYIRNRQIASSWQMSAIPDRRQHAKRVNVLSAGQDARLVHPVTAYRSFLQATRNQQPDPTDIPALAYRWIRMPFGPDSTNGAANPETVERQ